MEILWALSELCGLIILAPIVAFFVSKYATRGHLEACKEFANKQKPPNNLHHYREGLNDGTP